MVNRDELNKVLGFMQQAGDDSQQAQDVYYQQQQEELEAKQRASEYRPEFKNRMSQGQAFEQGRIREEMIYDQNKRAFEQGRLREEMIYDQNKRAYEAGVQSADFEGMMGVVKNADIEPVDSIPGPGGIMMPLAGTVQDNRPNRGVDQTTEFAIGQTDKLNSQARAYYNQYLEQFKRAPLQTGGIPVGRGIREYTPIELAKVRMGMDPKSNIVFDAIELNKMLVGEPAQKLTEFFTPAPDYEIRDEDGNYAYGGDMRMGGDMVTTVQNIKNERLDDQLPKAQEIQRLITKQDLNPQELERLKILSNDFETTELSPEQKSRLEDLDKGVIESTGEMIGEVFTNRRTAQNMARQTAEAMGPSAALAATGGAAVSGLKNVWGAFKQARALNKAVDKSKMMERLRRDKKLAEFKDKIKSRGFKDRAKDAAVDQFDDAFYEVVYENLANASMGAGLEFSPDEIGKGILMELGEEWGLFGPIKLANVARKGLKDPSSINPFTNTPGVSKTEAEVIADRMAGTSSDIDLANVTPDIAQVAQDQMNPIAQNPGMEDIGFRVQPEKREMTRKEMEDLTSDVDSGYDNAAIREEFEAGNKPIIRGRFNNQDEGGKSITFTGGLGDKGVGIAVEEAVHYVQDKTRDTELGQELRAWERSVAEEFERRTGTPFELSGDELSAQAIAQAITGQENTKNVSIFSLPEELSKQVRDQLPTDWRTQRGFTEGLIRGEDYKVRSFKEPRSGQGAQAANVQRERFSLLGENAKGADKEMLKRAKAMESEGVDADTIWSETGWAKNPDDGVWAWEVSNKNVDTSKLLESGNAMEWTTLKNIPGMEEVIEAYPDMADLQVQANQDAYYADPKVGAYHSPPDIFGNAEHIKMFKVGRDVQQDNKNLIHEVQHAIQDRAGMDSGLNPSLAESINRKGIAENEKTLKAVSKETRALEKLSRYYELEAQGRGENYKKRVIDKDPKALELLPKLPNKEAVENRYATVLDLGFAAQDAKEARDKATKLDVYANNAGEKVARVTEDRYMKGDPEGNSVLQVAGRQRPSPYTAEEIREMDAEMGETSKGLQERKVGKGRNPFSEESFKEADMGNRIDENLTNAYGNMTKMSKEDAKRRVRESKRYSLDMSEPRELIAVHNTRDSVIPQIIKDGGLISPSIGVVKKGIPMDGFGDVSFIMNKSTVDPKRAGNLTYPNDAYTPRRPTTSKRYKLSSAKTLNDLFNAIESPFDQVEMGRIVDEGDMEYAVNNNQIELADRYLRSKGMESIDGPVREDVTIKNDLGASFLEAELPKEFTPTKRSYSADLNEWVKDPEKREALVKAYISAEARNTRMELKKQGIEDLSEQRKILRTLREDYKELFYREDGTLPERGVYNKLWDSKTMEKVWKSRKAVIDGTAEGPIDKVATRRKLRDLGANDWDVEEWVKQKAEEEGLITGEVMWDDDTGERVKATPNRILSTMTAADPRARESGFTDPTKPGPFRARVNKTFKSLDEMRSKKGNINKDWKGQKEEFEVLLKGVINHLSEDKPYNNESVAEALIAYAESGRDREVLETYMAEENLDNTLLDQDVEAYTDEYSEENNTVTAMELIDELLDSFETMGTDYFEAKPQRMVRFKEISEAVAEPGKISQRNKELLEQNGIKVTETDKKQEYIDGLNDKSVRFNLERSMGDVVQSEKKRLQEEGKKEPISVFNSRTVELLREGKNVPNSMPLKNWEGFLTKSKERGVGTTEEMKTTGFDQLVKTNPNKKMTKEELADWLESQQLELSETRGGETSGSWYGYIASPDDKPDAYDIDDAYSERGQYQEEVASDYEKYVIDFYKVTYTDPENGRKMKVGVAVLGPSREGAQNSWYDNPELRDEILADIYEEKYPNAEIPFEDLKDYDEETYYELEEDSRYQQAESEHIDDMMGLGSYDVNPTEAVAIDLETGEELDRRDFEYIGSQDNFLKKAAMDGLKLLTEQKDKHPLQSIAVNTPDNAMKEEDLRSAQFSSTDYKDYVLDGDEAKGYETIQVRLEDPRSKNLAGVYMSQEFDDPHWDPDVDGQDKPVVGFIRKTDKELDGEDTFFIEEIQTDWSDKLNQVREDVVVDPMTLEVTRRVDKGYGKFETETVSPEKLITDSAMKYLEDEKNNIEEKILRENIRISGLKEDIEKFEEDKKVYTERYDGYIESMKIKPENTLKRDFMETYPNLFGETESDTKKYEDSITKEALERFRKSRISDLEQQRRDEGIQYEYAIKERKTRIENSEDKKEILLKDLDDAENAIESQKKILEKVEKQGLVGFINNPETNPEDIKNARRLLQTMLRSPSYRSKNPVKNSTALLVKRAIAEAIEQGKTRVGWTNPEQQSQRYNRDLNRHTDISVYAVEGQHEQGGRLVRVQVVDKADGQTLKNDVISEHELSSWIGGGAADKAKQDLESSGWTTGAASHLSGADGAYIPAGRGMIVAYSQVIPKEMEKLLKPYLGKKGSKPKRGQLESDQAIGIGSDFKQTIKALDMFAEKTGKDTINTLEVFNSASAPISNLSKIAGIGNVVHKDWAEIKGELGRAKEKYQDMGAPNGPLSVKKKQIGRENNQVILEEIESLKKIDLLPEDFKIPEYNIKDIQREAEKAVTNQYIDIPQEMVDDYRKNGFSRYNLDLPKNDGQGPKASLPNRTIFDLPPATLKESLYEDFVDRYDNLKRLEGNVSKAREENAEGEGFAKSPYRALELYPGRADEAIAKLDKAADAVIKIMVKDGFTPAQFSNFLYAKHAPERNARKAEENDGAQGLSGMTDEEAIAIMANFKEMGVLPAMERAAKILRKERNRLNEEMVKNGVRPETTQDAFDNSWDHYVPLKGTSNPLENVQKGGRTQGMQSRDNAKRAAGRTTRATSDILTTYLADMQLNAVQIEKAKVGNVLLDYMRENPNESFWQVDPPRTRKQYVDGQWVERPYPYRRGEPNVFTVQDQNTGEDVNVVFHTPEGQKLAQSLNGMDQETSSKVLKALGTLNSYLGSILTSYNPPFVISNALRDAQTAIYNIGVEKDLKTAAKTAKGAPAAMKEIYRDRRGKFTGDWGKYWQELQEAGGKTGFAAVPDVEKKLEEIQEKYTLETAKWGKNPTKKVKKTAKDFLDLVEDMNTSVENALRLSYYRTLREQGVSKEEAASEAKNLTVNFNRKGNYGSDLNKLFLFFNAAVQGSDRIWQSYKKDPKKFAGLAATLTSVGFTLGMWNQLMSGDDEDSGVTYWEKQPDFQKASNFMIMMPGGKGQHIKIPMPYGHNALVSMGYRMADVIFNPRTNRMDQAAGMMNDVVGAANPLGSSGSPLNMVSPTVTDLYAELYLNQNFAGNPIYRENSPFGRAPKPNAEMGFRKTNPLIKAGTRALNKASGGSEDVSGAFDINPDVVEHIIEGYTGGTGKFFKNVYETIHRGSKGEFIPEKTPFLSKVYGADNQFYDQAQFYNTGAKSLKKILQKGREPFNRAKRKGVEKYFSKEGLTSEANAKLNKEAKELSKRSHGYVVLESLYNSLKTRALPRMRKGRVDKDQQVILMQFFNKAKNRIMPLQEQLDKVKDVNSPRAEKIRKAIDKIIKDEERRLKEKYADK